MELAGIIIAALSLLITAGTFIWDKLLSRKQRTLEALSELKDSYHDEIAGKNKKKESDDYYRTCVKFFGKLDSFCAGALSGYYSYRAVKNGGGKLIVRLYKEFKEYLIDQRRKQFKDAEYYISIEKLAAKLDRSLGHITEAKTESSAENE